MIEKHSLEKYILEGLSQRQIAAAESCSQSTIKYWLRVHSVKTDYQTKKAYTTKIAEHECKTHGMTDWVWITSSKQYRCRQCRIDSVKRGRHKLKKALLDHLGGKCTLCGYDKSSRALHFHHKRREDKEFEMARLISLRSWDRAFSEAEKCELVCANCHAELEENLESK